VYAGLLAWGVIFDRRIDKAVMISAFFPFLTGVGVTGVGVFCVSVLLTHTHTACGVLGCETLGEPEESRCTESHDTYNCIFVQSTHVYIYAMRRHEILD